MFALLLHGWLALAPALAPPATEAVTLQGEAVLLAEALPEGWKVDAATIAGQVVIRTETG